MYYFIHGNMAKVLTFIMFLVAGIIFLGASECERIGAKKYTPMCVNVNTNYKFLNGSYFKTNRFLIQKNDTLSKFTPFLFKKTKKDSLIDADKTVLASLEEIKQQLYAEVNVYIRKYAPNSKMTGEKIVDACLESNYDIPLLLSQAHNESHFGTTTKKVFGIKNKQYKHPNNAIMDYIELMQQKYVKTRSVESALNAGLNVEGSRCKYAGIKSYATKIKLTRANIKNNTDIDNLTEKVKSLEKKKDVLTNHIKILES